MKRRSLFYFYTRKNALLQICKQVVTQGCCQSRYQDVFALLVTSCLEQVVITLLKKVDDSNRRLYVTSCYELVITLAQLLASLLASSTLSQDDNVVPDLSTTGNKQCEQFVDQLLDIYASNCIILSV